MDNTPVIMLLGPTACGKTALSLQLARELQGEIISVDSALVYRGMNIGTAKPSPAERAEVPHHLIDICDPTEAYSAARFCEDAMAVIRDVQSRGRVPLLTGGTMLYFKALEEGLAPLPEADPVIRAELMERAERQGWQSLHRELSAVDPISAERIHPNDPQRLQRALEVYRITGEPLSKLQERTESPLEARPIKFALLPESRNWLHKRISRRFQIMMTAGFVDEVRTLRKITGLHSELPSMRSVGYRQAWAFIEGEYELDEFEQRGIAATRQLAKRQMTWIRGMANLRKLSCDTLTEQEQLKTILTVLATNEIR